MFLDLGVQLCWFGQGPIASFKSLVETTLAATSRKTTLAESNGVPKARQKATEAHLLSSFSSNAISYDILKAPEKARKVYLD